MTKIVKRYCLCAIFIVALVLIVYYNIFGRDQYELINYQDEFVAVAYVDDYDDQKRDVTEHLVNLTDFRYMLEPNLCNKPEKNEQFLGEKPPPRLNTDQSIEIWQFVSAILLVTSYVGHDEVRAAHRAAISSATLRELNIFRVFLLAKVPPTEKYITQKAIESENRHFGDIVQGNFVEAYRNLTYKHVMGLRWASSTRHCIKTKFIIKMDDDIVVDFFSIANYLNDPKFNGIENRQFLAGYVFSNVIPIRLQQNKWYVSQDEYDGTVYPDYLSGWMYVTTPFTARALVAAAGRSKFFWIDDTWITGILRDKQKIIINESLSELFSANSQFLDCCIDDMKRHRYDCPFIAGPNGGDHKLIQKFVSTIFDRCFDNNSLDLTKNYNKCHPRPKGQPTLKDTCVGSDKHLLKENHGAAIVSAMRL